MKTQSNRPQIKKPISLPEIDATPATEEIKLVSSGDHVTPDRNLLQDALFDPNSTTPSHWSQDFIRRQLLKLDSDQDQVKITISAVAKFSLGETRKTIETSVTRDAKNGHYILSFSAKDISGIATPSSSPLQLFGGIGKEAKVEVRLADPTALENALFSISNDQLFEAEQFSVEFGISGELSAGLSIGTSLNKTTQLEFLGAEGKASHQFAARVDIHRNQSVTASLITRTQLEGSAGTSPKLVSEVGNALKQELAGFGAQISRKILLEETQMYQATNAEKAMEGVVSGEGFRRWPQPFSNKLKVERIDEEILGIPNDNFRITDGQIKTGKVFSIDVSLQNKNYSLRKILKNSLRGELALSEYVSTLGTVAQNTSKFTESCLGMGHSIKTSLASASLSVKACHHDRSATRGTVYIRDRACVELPH